MTHPSPSVCGELAEFAATARGWVHRERLALHAADGVLALLAGRETSEGRALRDFHARHDATDLGVAGMNAALIRHTEIDDIHRPTAVTATAIALPALLPWAAGVTADRFIDAFFVGQEVAVRAAHAMGGAALMVKGLWPSYLAAPIGAAAASGRLLGLSTDRMQHALALALAQTPRAPGKTAGDRPGRWLLFGQAVRAGCLSALAARDGIDGDPSLLGDAWLAGIGGVGRGPITLPKTAVIDALSIKPHCAAKQALAAIEGLKQLLARGIDASTIETIELHVPTACAAMLQREPASAGRLASMVNASWQMALTAFRPTGLDDIERLPKSTDAALVALGDRVIVRADTALDALYPERWPARVVVSTATRLHEVVIEDSPGDPALRFDAAQLMDKARRILKRDTDIAFVTRTLELHTDDRVVPQLAARFGLKSLNPTPTHTEAQHAHR